MGDRRAAERRGRLAETLAALVLRAKGYRILARDLRRSTGEIDLIVRRGRVLAFVEVKRRALSAAAAEAVTAHQRRRIMRTAAGFVARRPELAGLDQRFDVVLIVPRRWPQHMIDAWRP